MPVQKNFGMRLAPHERRQIERLAEARGTTMKEAVMQAVRRQLHELDEGDHERPFKARPGSVLEGLEDLVGCCEGPSDLSTNKAYMEGYGS